MSKRPAEYFRYPVIGPRDREWGLWVTGAGYQPAAAGDNVLPDRPHPAGHFYVWKAGRILHEFGLLYVTHGRGEFESQSGGHVDIEPGDAILLFPDEWHRYRANRETGWGVYWVHFLGEIADNLRQRGHVLAEQAVLKIGMDEAILDAFTKILDTLRTEPPGLPQILAAVTLEILGRVLGKARSQQHLPHLQEIVSKARMMLDEDPSILPVVDELIAGFDVSRTHFFRVFKEQTGLTPYQYHLQLKLRRAREMLRNSDMSIKQVAMALRFQNPYHFSQLFKKKTGMSPSRYRQRGRKR